MRRSFRQIALFCIVLAFILVPLAGAASKTVSLYFEDAPVEFEGHSPFYDEGVGIIMAPLSLFSQQLGAQVEYQTQADPFTITGENGTSITFTVGESTARQNNRAVTLDTPPLILDETVYVPLRFTAESLGYALEWSAEGQRVDLFVANTHELHISQAEMLKRYGQPVSASLSEKGYTWQVYHEEYRDYQLVGLDEDQVVAYYMYSDNWQLPFDIKQGMKLSSCATILGALGYTSTAGTGFTSFISKDTALTLYHETSGDNLVYAALFEDAAYFTKLSITEETLASLEGMLWDLTNITRAAQGLSPLTFDDAIAKVAQTHAADMAEHSSFSHIGSDGLDKSGRMDAAGYQEYYISEAISKGFSNSFSVFASFLSNGSYKEIVSANFDSVGVGYAYNPASDGILYCVQLYYGDKD